MANIIAELTARIEDYRKDTKTPCKSYATEEAAEKATGKMAEDAAKYFTAQKFQDNIRPARYVVFYNEAWGRWVGCVDMTELINRNTSTGGYLGFCKGFFTY